MTDQPESPLVANPEAFVGIPSRPILRERQLEEVRNCFSGGLTTVHPIHAWVYGSPGTGKTLCVRYVLEQEAGSAGWLPVFVNCREKFTFLSIVEGILDKVKPLRSPQRSRERQLAFLSDTLRNRRSVIALDEINVIKREELADLLHHLSSLPRTSIICISSSRLLLLKLPESIRSRLAPRQVLFPRYQPEDMTTILRQTIRRGLKPGTWVEEALERIAEHSYGDARRGLALLRHAVQRAQESGATTLLPDHLQLSNFNYYNPQVEDHLSLLSSHHRILYDLVCSRDTLPGTELAAEYSKVCERQKIPPVSPRALSKYLTVLCQRQILHRERGAQTSGWIYRVATTSQSGALSS